MLEALVRRLIPRVSTHTRARAHTHTHIPEMRVVPIDCDLMDFQSVKRAYVELRTKFPDGIDALCLNGGINP
jgi:hypothetical protein